MFSLIHERAAGSIKYKSEKDVHSFQRWLYIYFSTELYLIWILQNVPNK